MKLIFCRYISFFRLNQDTVNTSRKIYVTKEITGRTFLHPDVSAVALRVLLPRQRFRAALLMLSVRLGEGSLLGFSRICEGLEMSHQRHSSSNAVWRLRVVIVKTRLRLCGCACLPCCGRTRNDWATYALLSASLVSEVKARRARCH